MSERFSLYLKVVFVPEDLCEMRDSILRSNCFTVQHFHYESERRRDSRTGTGICAENSTVMDLTIRINDPDCGKRLLAHMQDKEMHTYSFLFNATFKPTGRIEDYEDAMVAGGYIIGIKEDFSTTQAPDRQEQMLMHIRLLVSSITFVGKNNHLVFKV